MRKETFRQKIARKLYSFVMKMGRKGKNGTVLKNNDNVTPINSFYDLKVEKKNGEILDFSTFRGQQVLLVNTASNCGYTAQFGELQSLNEKFYDKLNIIGFPANDFAEQEKGDDKEITQFCQLNYGVSFPMMPKASVVKNENQQEVFKWLTNKSLNGWNNHQPDWNFSKYLIAKDGTLKCYFGPSISPLDDELINQIED